MEESRAVRAMVEQKNEHIRSLARTPTEMASWIETVREGELPYSSRNYLFQCLEREAEKSLPKGKRFSEYDVTDAAQDRRRGIRHVLGSALERPELFSKKNAAKLASHNQTVHAAFTAIEAKLERERAETVRMEQRAMEARNVEAKGGEWGWRVEDGGWASTSASDPDSEWKEVQTSRPMAAEASLEERGLEAVLSVSLPACRSKSHAAAREGDIRFARMPM